MESYEPLYNNDNNNNCTLKCLFNRIKRLITVKNYVFVLYKLRFIIFLCFIGLAAYGATVFSKFMNNTTMEFHLPNSDAAVIGRNKALKYIGASYAVNNHIVFVECIHTENNECTIISSVIANFTMKIQETLNNYGGLHGQYGYFININLPSLRDHYVDDDRVATYSIFQQLGSARGKQAKAYQKLILNEVDLFNKLYTNTYNADYVSRNLYSTTYMSAIIKQLAQMDIIVIPLTFFVVALTLRSVILLMIPLITTPVSAALTFLMLYPLSKHTEFAAFSVPLFMGLILAMNIDYALFLLTRYKEEIVIFIESDMEINSLLVVSNMLKYAGRTVLISCTTLICAFATILLCPFEWVSSIGSGASLALLSTLLVNLILTPVILLMFPKLFKKSVNDPCCRCFDCFYKKCNDNDDNDYHDIMRLDLLQDDPNDSSISSTTIERNDLFRNDLSKNLKYSNSYRLCRKYPLLVIIMIAIIGLPIAWQSFFLQINLDESLLIPRDSVILKTLGKLMHYGFPCAYTPFYVLFYWPPPSKDVPPSDYFFTPLLVNETHELINGILKLDHFDPFTIRSHAFVNAENVPALNATCYYSKMYNLDIPTCSSFQYDNEKYEIYKIINNLPLFSVKDGVTPTKVAFGIEMYTAFDPMGYQVESWMDDVKDYINNFHKSSKALEGSEFYLTGLTRFLQDALKDIYQTFPTVIILTIIIVFVLICISFLSIIVALRLLITIVFTLTWVYGAGVLVFQKNYLSIFPIFQNVHYYHWIVPLTTVSFLTGLTLDYDVFLMSRIYEYRKQGYSEESSIILGTKKTSNIISSAGIIMMIAFSSLMLSSEPVLTQFGFLISFAVLVDTFIVRTILVPCLMLLWPKYNWWPQKMPECKYDIFK